MSSVLVFSCVYPLESLIESDLLGRRVLHAYLMTFLHAYTPLTPTPPFTQPPSEPKPDLKISELPPPSDALEQDFNEIIEKVVDTRSLGEHVGGAWQIERVMRWVPNVDQHSDVASITAEEAAVSGLFTIRGTTVQGVVGGVFHQFVSTLYALDHIFRIDFLYREELQRTGCSTPEYSPTSLSSSPRNIESLLKKHVNVLVD